MARVLVMMSVIALALSVCMLCGFSIQGSVLIVVGGIVSLGVLGWIVEGFRVNLLRCMFLWWISKMLDKPEMLHRDSETG